MGDRVAVMSLGLLQQVDTPQRLYDQPANLFVAGFIGTPPMNLLEGDVRLGERHGHALDRRAARRALGPDARPLPRSAPQVGKPVVLGVRSDDLLPAADAAGLPTVTGLARAASRRSARSRSSYFRVDAKSLRDQIVAAEELEAEVAGEGVTATRPNLVASFPARDALGLELGKHIPIAVDISNAHLFDRETGEPLR